MIENMKTVSQTEITYASWTCENKEWRENGHWRLVASKETAL